MVSVAQRHSGSAVQRQVDRAIVIKKQPLEVAVFVYADLYQFA